MAYNGNRIADLDVNKPDGSTEYPAVVDDAIREVKRALKNLEIDESNDVPSKSGNSGKALVVKSDESGFEYIDYKLGSLLDVESPSGHGDEFLKVKPDETGFEYAGFFPSGTCMLFYNETAPPGWSIKSDGITNGNLVYIDNQNGGTQKSGGTWTISGLSGGSHSHGAGSYKAASHNHQWYYCTGGTNRGKTYDSDGSLMSPGYAASGEYRIEYDNNHDAINVDCYTSKVSPSVTGTSGSATVPISSNGSWRPPGYNFIIAEKD